MDVQEIRKLEHYLRTKFGNARLRVVPRPKKDDSAELYIGEKFVGVMTVDDEDEERSYDCDFSIDVPGAVPHSRGGKAGGADVEELRKVEGYMKTMFGTQGLVVRPRAKKGDSAEVYVGDEFIGVLFMDEKGSYNFNMGIVAFDLEGP